MKEVKTIFIVDDDQTQCMMLQDYLSKYSTFEIKIFNSGEDCLQSMKNLVPQIIFLDYYFDKAGKEAMNGVEVLKEIKNVYPDVEVVMFSGQDKIEVAVNTIKYGAFDYIVKSESAFHRSENIIFNIIKRFKLMAEAKKYKQLTYFFAIAFTLTLIAIFIAWKNGYIANNPGWI